MEMGGVEKANMITSYHVYVSRMLTELVRVGYTIKTDANGMAVTGSMDTTVYYIGQGNHGPRNREGYLYRRTEDNYGRSIKLERLEDRLDWVSVPLV